MTRENLFARPLFLVRAATSRFGCSPSMSVSCLSRSSISCLVEFQVQTTSGLLYVTPAIVACKAVYWRILIVDISFAPSDLLPQDWIHELPNSFAGLRKAREYCLMSHTVQVFEHREQELGRQIGELTNVTSLFAVNTFTVRRICFDFLRCDAYLFGSRIHAALGAGITIFTRIASRNNHSSSFSTYESG